MFCRSFAFVFLAIVANGNDIGFLGRYPPVTEELASGPDVAFAPLFRYMEDGQRSETWKYDDPTSIKPWRESCERIGMSCTVFHDAFSPEFVHNYSSSHVTFMARHPVVDSKYVDPLETGFTPYDERYLDLLRILEEPEAARLEYVLLTDASDVEFRKNPFKLMRAMDTAMDSHYVFAGEEWRPRALFNPINETAMSRLVPYWKNCFNEEMPESYTMGRMVNAGLFGGHVKVVKPFLRKMRKHYLAIPEERRFFVCDMLVFAKTIFEDYNDRVVSGYPLQAKFKNVDLAEEAAVYHKSPIPPPDYPKDPSFVEDTNPNMRTSTTTIARSYELR